MHSEPGSDLEYKTLINQQTARIPWHDLQRFFASGKTLHVSAELDLIDVALAMHKDDSTLIEHWMSKSLLRPVNDDEARSWFERDESLWAVVLAPWVLIQPEDDGNT